MIMYIKPELSSERFEHHRSIDDTTGAQIWERLNSIYTKREIEGVLSFIVRDGISYEWRTAIDDVAAFVNEVNSISDKLASCGDKLSDRDIIFKLLKGLPPSWDSVNAALRVGMRLFPEKITPSVVVSQLLLEQEFQRAGVVHQRSAPYTPQHNGVAERANRSVQEMACTMLVQAGLPNILWPEAVTAAVHIKNQLPHRALRMPPGVTHMSCGLASRRMSATSVSSAAGHTCRSIPADQQRKELVATAKELSSVCWLPTRRQSAIYSLQVL